jgi:phosphate/sulfate permease
MRSARCTVPTSPAPCSARPCSNLSFPLQVATIRNMVMAWVLTLPVAILLSGTLYVIFSHLF